MTSDKTSILNYMIIKREACSLIVQQVIDAFKDNSWRIECGDIVHMDSDHLLACSGNYKHIYAQKPMSIHI